MFRRSKSVAGNARALNVFSFWFSMRFFGIVAVLYFAQVTGSYALAVSVIVIARVAQAVFEVPTGVLSDRWGRVWCLRLGALASLVAIVCYRGESYWWLVAGAVLDGLWRALFSGNNEALLYESVKQSGQEAIFSRYLGRLNVAMEVAGFLAAALGGLVAAHSFGWALGLTAVVQVPTLVTSFWLVEPAKHEVPTTNVWAHVGEAFGYMRRNPTLRNLSLAQIISEGCSTFALWPAFYAQLLPRWAIGLVMSANYLESAVGFGVSGWFVKRFAAIKIMLASRVYTAALMIPAVVFPSPLSPALLALGGALYGPETVATGVLLHKEFTDHQRATMASINAVLTNVVFAVFGLAVGWVADGWGVGRAILVGQICLLAMVWLYWRVWRGK